MIELHYLQTYYKFFVVATKKKVAWNFNFQLPQYKCSIIVTYTEVVNDPASSAVKEGSYDADSIW